MITFWTCMYKYVCKLSFAFNVIYIQVSVICCVSPCYASTVYIYKYLLVKNYVYFTNVKKNKKKTNEMLYKWAVFIYYGSVIILLTHTIQPSQSDGKGRSMIWWQKSFNDLITEVLHNLIAKVIHELMAKVIYSLIAKAVQHSDNRGHSQSDSWGWLLFQGETCKNCLSLKYMNSYNSMLLYVYKFLPHN